MYRPPQNTNIVKSIKSKFENIENNNPPERNNFRKNGHWNHLNNSPRKTEGRPVLQKQISDPLKRNIKRTPAFRLDKSVDSNSEFQRNTLFENKVKQFSAVKQNCDTNDKSENRSSIVKDVVKKVPHSSNSIKPVLVKSKSSHDFQYIKSKFNKYCSNNLCKNADVFRNTCSCNEDLSGVDLSLLYTEPVPKALRYKNANGTEMPVNITFPFEPKSESIYNSSTLKLTDKFEAQSLSNLRNDSSLTDTLKTALTKPLPPGPAPQKPPRTFQHSKSEQTEDMVKNISFLHVTNFPEHKVHTKPKSAPKKEKADPKYMLNKLETALRNNKLRARKQARVDISTTSGEDSDDSLLFQSKSNRTLPKLPVQASDYCNNASAFNLNCLNALSCSVANYEKIKEPNSSFFVARPKEEPVYCEPFHYRKDSPESPVTKREGSTRSARSTRNSLYYMSTPVLSGEGIMSDNGIPDKQDETNQPLDLKLSRSLCRQVSAENSSLSSFTSDLDSTPSPMEEASKIKGIIECYEMKNNSVPSSATITGNGLLHSPVDSANRVENLKNTLQQTLDRTFACDGVMRDSDSENYDNENKVLDIIRKFETYRLAMPKYCRPKIHKDTLFYCCLIIEKVRDVAQIKLQFPSCAEVPQNLESLCFPESDNIPMDVKNSAHSYALLITNDKGERMFGYCRRVLPEGCHKCLPLAYCILSKYRAPRFYKKVLIELETRHGLPNKTRDELISQFYNQKFPKPGESIRINLNSIEPGTEKTENKENLKEPLDLGSYVHINKTGSFRLRNDNNVEEIYVNRVDIKKSCSIPSYIVTSDDNTELVVTLHPDTRYEDSDLKILHRLPADIVLKIFSSMLLERKVVLISSMISNLSTCVDSLQSILYPFTWHHTFIPILPESLWDIVESPTPVICGVLSREVMRDRQFENGIVVDLDSGIVQKEEGDENKILSGSMQKVWKRSIALANKAAASMDYVHSVYLSDAYLQIFIICFKDYKKFFVSGVFQKEEFIKHGKTKGIRRFLKMFTETYMFLAFLDMVTNNPENLIEFDKKIEMYGSDDSHVILDKLLEWNK